MKVEMTNDEFIKFADGIAKCKDAMRSEERRVGKEC